MKSFKEFLNEYDTVNEILDKLQTLYDDVENRQPLNKTDETIMKIIAREIDLSSYSKNDLKRAKRVTQNLIFKAVLDKFV